MKNLNILLTCVGGLFSVETIRMMKSDVDFAIRVIGVDANPATPNRFFADRFYSVPLAKSDPTRFIQELLLISQKESTQIILPGSDEEAFELSKNKKQFEERGIRCAVDSFETIRLLRDKFECFSFLKNKGIDVPMVYDVSTVDALPTLAVRMGYPEKRFIIKPKMSRGARNIFFVDSRATAPHSPNQQRESRWCDLDTLLTEYRERIRAGECMAMEYVPGPSYDVDCIASQGQVLCVLPRKREWPDEFSSFNQGCLPENNGKIQNLIAEIAQALSLNTIFDFDCGTRENGLPGLYEINPRMSGSIASCRAGNVNLLNILFRYLLNMPIPVVEFQYGKRMIPVLQMIFQ